MSIVCGRKYPNKFEELVDDHIFVRSPHRVGRSILLYGKKTSNFPYHCFVGPDWPCMCVSYCLMIVPTILFIHNVGMRWGPGVVFAALFLLIVTLSFFTYTACSDPGIIFISEKLSDEEDPHDIESTQITTNKIECGICQIDRPRDAYHCYDCGVCIQQLDHHCPWTGKCIGKKTIKTFYGFLTSLALLIAFVVFMVVTTAVRGDQVFNFKTR